MPNPSLKVQTWSGKFKTRVRFLKKYEIEKFIEDEKQILEKDDNWRPNMLTFSGPEAVLERVLCNWNILRPKNITTVQTYEKLSQNHNGKQILNKLIRTRRNHLAGMDIWPYNFHSFSNKYKASGCSYPSSSKTAVWNKNPYKSFMKRIVEKDTKKFGILDLDLCGIFSKKNSDSVINLFKHKVIDEGGVCFITHQKGRDVRGGKLFSVLHDYLKNCGLIDFDSIPDIDTEGHETYVARYFLIPLYYMCKIYEYGYVVKLTRLVEYRDKNKSSGLAVNMLQYFFTWRDSFAITDPHEEFKANIQEVLDDSYTYNNWIDAE